MVANQRFFAGLVTLVFLYVTYPLLLPIAMGGVVAVLFTPCLNWLERRKLSRAVSAGFLTLAITVVLILPASFLIFFGVKTGFYQLQDWRKSQVVGGGFLEGILDLPGVRRFMLWITNWIPIGMDELASAFQDFAGSVGTKLTDLLGGALTHLPGVMVAMLLIIVSIYFFLVDGTHLVSFFRRNSFFTPRQTDRLLWTIAGMCRSVILAAVVSGTVQAILEMIVCALANVPNVELIGFLVFVGSFIPLVGCFPITFGVAMHQLIEGRQGVGVTLLIMSFIILGIDNMIRPLFLKGSANLHPFLGFVAAFGGLQTMGFFGVFLGPVLAALFVCTIQILTQSEGAA